MTGLTDHQQALLVFTAGLLGTVGTYLASSLSQNPTLFPAWVAIIPSILGAAVSYMKEFAGATPQQQQTVIDEFRAALPAIQKFMALTPDQQKAALALLALEEPAVSPQPT